MFHSVTFGCYARKTNVHAGCDAVTLIPPPGRGGEKTLRVECCPPSFRSGVVAPKLRAEAEELSVEVPNCPIHQFAPTCRARAERRRKSDEGGATNF